MRWKNSIGPRLFIVGILALLLLIPAGMISGLLVTLAYMLLNAWNPDLNILGITNVAAGIFGVPVNFIVTYTVSKLTAPPSAKAQALVEALRQP